MRKHNLFRKLCVSAFGVVAFGAFSCGALALNCESVAGDSTNLQNYNNLLSYNPEDFTLTEEYEAWGDAVTLYGSNYVLMDPNGIQRARLDYGKSGVLLETTKTGADAENASFEFSNTLYGEFSLDFRVFCENSYVGSKTAVNNALDLRSFGVTFTSASDATKNFTVYFYGTHSANTVRVTSSVAIEGETYGDGFGYGVNESNGVGVTFLKGSTFSNVYSKVLPCGTSTGFSFDPNAMQVCGESITMTALGASKGYDYVEETVLIRDLDDNALSLSAGASQATGEGLSSLSAEDFASGYTVKVTVLDVTEDEDAERTAKILLYNVCGQSLQKQEGFSVETLSYDFPTYSGSLDAPATSAVSAKGYRLTANAKNADAEGNTFVVDGDEFVNTTSYNGQAVFAIGALSTQYAPKDAWENLNYFSLDYYGLGDRMLEQDPYSDVREIGVTFRSKSDSTKAFTVYIRSSGSRQADNMIARVGIEGEAYRNTQGSYGFTMDYTYDGYGAFGRNDYQYVNIGGTMGMYTNTYVSGYSDKYANLRFDPQTMKVYAYGGENNAKGWLMLRDLSDDTPAMGNATTYLSNTLSLSAEDFTGGYDVEISIEQMNTEWNRGRKNLYSYRSGSNHTIASSYAATDGYVLSEGYDRPAIIDVFAINDNAELASSSLTYNTQTSYEGNSDRLIFKNLSNYVSRADDLTVNAAIVDVFGAEKSVDSISYVNKDGSDAGVITFTNNEGTFSPNTFGEYTFTYGKLTKSVYVTTPYAPVVSFADGLKTKIYQGDSFSVTDKDIVVETEWGFTVDVTCTCNGRTVEASAVTSENKGKYEITYLVTDEGGRDVVVKRTVYVVDADDTAPVIAWDAPVVMKLGESLDLTEIRAYDEFEGFLTCNVQSVVLKVGDAETVLAVENGKVTPTQTGEIFLSVVACDEAGNEDVVTYRILVLENSTVEGGTNSSLWWLVAVVGGVAVVATCGVVFFVLRKKKA